MERADERRAFRFRRACRPVMSGGWRALRETDRDLALALLFAPVASRDLIADRLSLAMEAETAMKLASEPMLAAIRLQWWVEAIQNPSGTSPVWCSFPLGQPLRSLSAIDVILTVIPVLFLLFYEQASKVHFVFFSLTDFLYPL